MIIAATRRFALPFLFWLLAADSGCARSVSPLYGSDTVMPDGADVPIAAMVDAPPVCHFASGRPCAVGACCTDWCNACQCSGSGNPSCTAALCGGDASAVPSGGGRHDCDPALVRSGSCIFQICGSGLIHSVVDGHYGPCVPVVDCNPIACDPAFPDSCPPPTACDPSARVCRVR